MRKTLSFLLVLALAVCMLPGLALAEEAPTFDLTKDLKDITIPNDLVTCTCTKTNESKQYGQLPNGFSASKVIKEGEVWTVIISVEKAVYMAQFNKDTGSTHAPDMNHSNDFTTPIQFKLKYEGNKWMLDGAMPKNKTLHFTCDGKHLMPRPDHPTADAIDGLGKDIVGVVCANAPDKSKFYGLIDGGFSTTEPEANAENVYESTITLSPSAYCNQYNTDTGIEHTLNPNQTTDGLSFTVKYDPEKKMWMPVEEVKKMAIWVNCEKHEAQQPEMPMYPTTDNISGLNDKIVAVLCTNVPAGQQSGKYYGLISGGFTSTEPMFNKEDKVYESTITLIPSAYCNQFSTDTGIMHNVLSTQTTEGLSFKVKYDPEKKMWMPVKEVKQMGIWVVCDKHEVQQPEMPMYPTTDNIGGLNDKIVAVLCTNVPAGQQSGRYYGLLNGGFTSTEPKLNDGMYESTITLIPSVYCNQFSTDTGIMHRVLSTQTTEGLSFKVKYDPEKKMWMPVDEVKQMGIWVVCDKHEVQTRYTITYSDGMNGSIFATENYADLKAGDTTPSFKGSTYRYGYRFDGWKPAWSATVSGNVTYVAQWTYVGGGGGGHYHPNPTSVPPMIKPPQTGDNSNTTLWLALLLVSGGALVGIAVFAQKRRKTQ